MSQHFPDFSNQLNVDIMSMLVKKNQRNVDIMSIKPLVPNVLVNVAWGLMGFIELYLMQNCFLICIVKI